MIIGYDGSRAFSKDRTGTENYSYQLLKSFAKIDKKNQYIIYLRSQGQALQGWPDNFQFKIINWPRFWTQGGLAINTFNDKLDILFVPAHTLPIIRKPGLKIVITVHDLGSEYLPSMHQLKQRLYLSFMQHFQLKSASKIIAVSKATKDDLVKRIGIKPSKIEVIYEGYDQNLFSVGKQSSTKGRSIFKPVRNDVLVNSLKPYYLFVGTVQPRKNLERIIKAFERILRYKDTKILGANISRNIPISKYPDLDFAIVGQKGWLSDEIYKLPGKLGIEERVKFLGYVPDEQLPALYSGAIALVFPSLFEGFGLPILEAQACGCPVITSNVSSMPEVGGKGAIYVDPYSMDDIVRGMEKVQSAKWRVQSVKAGLENIKKFSWEKCATQTLKVFEDLL